MAFKDPNTKTFQPIVDSLDGVDENIKSLYAETTDGKYQIRADIAFQSDFERVRDTLTKERTSNKELNAKLKELQSKLDAYGGIDPTGVKGMQTELANLKSTETDLSKIKSSKADLELQFKNLKEQFDELSKINQRYEKERTEQRLKDSARKAFGDNGILDSAMEDGLLWATQVLESAEDGSVRVKDGTKYPAGVSVDSWVQLFKKDKPHLFGGSVGGGAGGSVNNSIEIENWTNTGLDGGINVTKLAQAIKDDPKAVVAVAKAKGLEKVLRERYGYLYNQIADK